MEEKPQYVVGDKRVTFTIPITKANINVEKRIVSGWATIDNVDQTGDQVTADASLDAFTRFRGNVREMHDKHKAVGKVLHFEQREYTGDNGETHTGIYVDVYVSTGAEDTWQKVLDGTLSAFSVQGPIRNAAMKKMIGADSLVRVITKYDLVELSLVDNPGNELCDVISVEKMNQGLAVNVELKNVFWCEKDGSVETQTDEVFKCFECKEEMENLGWIEVPPVAENDTAEYWKSEVTKVLQAANKLEKTLDTKGGSDMSDEVKKEETTTETPEETVETVEEEKVEETKEEPTEEVEKTEEPDLAAISKALSEIQTALSESSVKTREETIAEIQKAVSGVEKSVDSRLNELMEKYNKLEEDVKGVKDGLGSFEKQLGTVLETVEKSSAIRKSADIESEEEQLEKGNIWAGNFFPLRKNYDN